MPSYPFLGEGSPTTIDYREKGTLSSAGELVVVQRLFCMSGLTLYSVDSSYLWTSMRVPCRFGMVAFLGWLL